MIFSLEEMSKPRQSREPRPRKIANKLEENEVERSSQIDNEEQTKDLQSESITKKLKPSAKFQKSLTSQSVEHVRPLTNELAIDGIMPKFQSREESKTIDMQSTDLPSNAVRSSLALLKTKTPKTRRRITTIHPEDDRNFPETTENSVLELCRNDLDVNRTEHHISADREIGNMMDDNEKIQPTDDVEPDFYESNLFESDYNDEATDGPQEGTMECPDCGRHFAPEPFSRHVRICKKVFVSKRKVFDSSKKRIEAIPELKSLLDNKKKTTKKQTQQSSSKSKNNWKLQSLAFREAMRAARGAANHSSDNVVEERTPYVDPSLIQCPNCLRRFNSNAAERHIPVCKNIIAKPSTLRKGSGAQATSKALQSSSSKLSATGSKKGWN